MVAFISIYHMVAAQQCVEIQLISTHLFCRTQISE